MLRVRATKQGVLHSHTIVPGDVFEVADEFFADAHDARLGKFGWMEKVGDDVPVTVVIPAVPRTSLPAKELPPPPPPAEVPAQEPADVPEEAPSLPADDVPPAEPSVTE